MTVIGCCEGRQAMPAPWVLTDMLIRGFVEQNRNFLKNYLLHDTSCGFAFNASTGANVRMGRSVPLLEKGEEKLSPMLFPEAFLKCDTVTRVPVRTP